MSPAHTPAPAHKRARFDLGRRVGFDPRIVRLTEQELMHHTLVLGTTGSGKTTASLTILCQAVLAGWGVVLIDLKGDPDNTAVLAGAAADVGMPYSQFSFTPGERCDGWSPLTAGDPAARMSKVICLSQWTEPYYQSACERFAQLAFVLLERRGIEPTFEELVGLLDDPSRMSSYANILGAGERPRVNAYLTRLLSDRGQLSALSGLAARIGTLTDLGGPLRTTRRRADLDLERISEHGGVACFSLNSARSAVTAAQIGSLAVLDVQSMVAKRIATGSITRPVIVCIDEFSALDADHLLGLFARARSSRVSMMVATQELADLARVREGFADQIIGLANNKLIMRQEVGTSAETLAKLIGTTTGTKQTRQRITGTLTTTNTGVVSERDVESFIVHPNVFRRLRTGEAVLLRKDPFRVDRIKVAPRLSEPDVDSTIATVSESSPIPIAIAPTEPEPESISVEDLDRLFHGRTL
ncbi:MAG: type secretory pathway VirD4 component-like protein [Thermoleophilia bacterium]|nr:type secretory pathway VirD4 component-like protein [Thermoleophilia bacterium]